MTEQEFLSELSAFVDSGERTKFRLLQNGKEYWHYRKVRYATKLVIKYLQELSEHQLKSYCKDVTRRASDVYALLAFKHIIRILECYKEEYNTVNGMLDEYECYLASGNWLDFIFNDNRPLDKMFDHRGE